MAIAYGAMIHALRGDREQAEIYRRQSRAYMVAVSGGTEHWIRNQHY